MLYGIRETPNSNLIYFNDEYGQDAGGTLIIGNTLSNGFIIYDYLGCLEKKGIYFWDDNYAYDCSSDECNAYYIAENFDELMKKANLKID